MKKTEEKDVKKGKKKIEKKDGKTTKRAKSKKETFFEGVKAELAKVKWPEKKDVLKYTIATLVFIIFLVIFFVIISLIMSLVKGAFN